MLGYWISYFADDTTTACDALSHVSATMRTYRKNSVVKKSNFTRDDEKYLGIYANAESSTDEDSETKPPLLRSH